MDSKELLEKAKKAYYNVQDKEYTKRSFIAGYLIGYAEKFRQYNVVRQSEKLICEYCNEDTKPTLCDSCLESMVNAHRKQTN